MWQPSATSWTAAGPCSRSSKTRCVTAAANALVSQCALIACKASSMGGAQCSDTDHDATTTGRYAGTGSPIRRAGRPFADLDGAERAWGLLAADAEPHPVSRDARMVVHARPVRRERLG